VHLVEIDDVGLEPLEARFRLLDDMEAGEPVIVGAVADLEANLGGDHGALAALLGHDLADDLFGDAAIVDIGGVEQIDTGIEAQVDLALGAGDVGIADLGAAAEGHGAHGDGGDLEPRTAQETVFHMILPQD
jgi:hypothetical protein